MPETKQARQSYLFMLPWTLSSLGGVNQVVKNLYSQMESTGQYNPIIMVNSWYDREIRCENIGGTDHFHLRSRNPLVLNRSIINFLLFFYEFINFSYKFSRFLKTENISVINFHYCSLTAMNVVLLKIFGVYRGKIFLSFHGKDLLDAVNSTKLESLLWRFVFHYVDNIITCSDSLKKDLIKFCSATSKKAIVIHNGVDRRLFSSNQGKFPFLKRDIEKFILNVATLEHKKGQDILLHAFREIKDDFPDVSLVLIGRPGDGEQIIKELIESLDLSQRVFLFEGLSHEQVLAFMQKSVLFVLPSRYEPFGIVILEAGAFGKAVVASKVGGVCEILSDNETGKLYEVGNHMALAGALREFLANSEECKRIGENLKNHVHKNFLWERTYSSYMNLT